MTTVQQGEKERQTGCESQREKNSHIINKSHYSPADIKKKFLQGREGSRLVKAEDYCSDLRLFVESAGPPTKKKGSGNVGDDVLTDQEIYHFKETD